MKNCLIQKLYSFKFHNLHNTLIHGVSIFYVYWGISKFPSKIEAYISFTIN